MLSVLGALIAVLLLTPVRAELDEGGPHNVVGYFTGGVTLQCNRDAVAGVKWLYIAPGTTIEGPVPGRHSYSGSSYGQYSLHLENLQRSDAGLYVCRSADVPQSFSPASAFLVVVADQPVCRVRAKADDKDELVASCRIVYNGMLNLTLSLVCAEDNSTVASRNYTSRVGGSWWHLETEVPVNSTAQPPKQYTCRAEFYSSKTHTDVANNRPPNIEVPCERPGYDGSEPTLATVTPDVFSRTGTTAGSVGRTFDNHSHHSEVEKEAPADNKSIAQAAVSMSAVALFLSFVCCVGIFWLIVRWIVRRQTRKRNIGRERPSTSGEHGDDTDNRGLISTLLEGDATNANCSAQDLSVEYHANTTNGPTVSLPTPERDGRSHTPASRSVPVSSGSVESVHSNHSVSLYGRRQQTENRDDDEEESSQKTLRRATDDSLLKA